MKEYSTMVAASKASTLAQREVLDLLLKYDINHIDVAHIYGDAELRIGPWMKSHRKNFFLATKTYERTYKGAKESIENAGGMIVASKANDQIESNKNDSEIEVNKE